MNRQVRKIKRISFSIAIVCFLGGNFSFTTSDYFKTDNGTANSVESFFAFTNPFVHSPVSNATFSSRSWVYDSLHLSNEGLSREAFENGLRGMENLANSGHVFKENIISILDFSQPSSNKRLYIIDLDNYELLFRTWVAHGKNSGREMAQSFSNKMSSNKSSLGFYITGNTYRGKHGYSLKLEGVEKGINDNALNRAIVMHAADYVNGAVLNKRGFIGRSQGCPAVPTEVCKPIIDNIKEGTCLFIYHPSEQYIQQTDMLN